MVGFRIQQRVQRLFDRRPNHFIQMRLNASFIDLYYRTQVPLDPVFRPSSRFHGWLHRARLRGLAPPACTNLHASNSNQMCERNPTLSYAFWGVAEIYIPLPCTWSKDSQNLSFESGKWERVLINEWIRHEHR